MPPFYVFTLAARLQEPPPSFSWTYLWLAGGGLLLVLTVLAFLYLLLRRSEPGRMLHHPSLSALDRHLSGRIPRLWRFIRRRFTIGQRHGLALTAALALFFTTVYLFALITESWTEEEALYAFDQQIYGWLTAAMNEQVATFMVIITHLGDGLTITIVSLVLGVLLLVRGYRWHVVALASSVGLGSVVMHGLKWLFERSRPTEPLAYAEGHSFPSGHAFLATTLYGFMIYLTWRWTRRDAVRIAVTIALTVLIVLIGLSRVILRVHWVSDVAGGFTVGLGWLICSLVITQALKTYRTLPGTAALLPQTPSSSDDPS